MRRKIAGAARARCLPQNCDRSAVGVGARGDRGAAREDVCWPGQREAALFRLACAAAKQRAPSLPSRGARQLANAPNWRQTRLLGGATLQPEVHSRAADAAALLELIDARLLLDLKLAAAEANAERRLCSRASREDEEEENLEDCEQRAGGIRYDDVAIGDEYAVDAPLT